MHARFRLKRSPWPGRQQIFRILGTWLVAADMLPSRTYKNVQRLFYRRVMAPSLRHFRVKIIEHVCGCGHQRESSRVHDHFQTPIGRYCNSGFQMSCLAAMLLALVHTHNVNLWRPTCSGRDGAASVYLLLIRVLLFRRKFGAGPACSIWSSGITQIVADLTPNCLSTKERTHGGCETVANAWPLDSKRLNFSSAGAPHYASDQRGNRCWNWGSQI